MAAEAGDHGFRLRLPDAAAMHRLGVWLGARLRAGDVLALVGDLGAGKTTLARGVAVGLAVDEPDLVCSSTYLLVVEHGGPVPMLHADAYLPAKLAAFLGDGGGEYLFDAAAVAVVEWADRVRNMLPSSTLWVRLELADDGARSAWVGGDPAAFPWLATPPKID